MRTRAAAHRCQECREGPIARGKNIFYIKLSINMLIAEILRSEIHVRAAVMCNNVRDPSRRHSPGHGLSPRLILPRMTIREKQKLTCTLPLQRLDGLPADHAPVGHDADPTNAEATPQAIHHGDERRHVGGVPGPQFAADRSPLTIEHRPDDHLVQVGPMVLAEPPLARVFPTIALEVDGGGIEEHQLKVGEEVTSMGEQLLFDPVFDAPGGERRLALLLVLGQLLAESGHDPVEVMELERITPFDLVVRPPLVGGSVAAGCEQAVQDSQEDRPLSRAGPSPGGIDPAGPEDELGGRGLADFGNSWPSRITGGFS